MLFQVLPRFFSLCFLTMCFQLLMTKSPLLLLLLLLLLICLYVAAAARWAGPQRSLGPRNALLELRGGVAAGWRWMPWRITKCWLVVHRPFSERPIVSLHSGSLSHCGSFFCVIVWYTIYGLYVNRWGVPSAEDPKFCYIKPWIHTVHHCTSHGMQNVFPQNGWLQKSTG